MHIVPLDAAPYASPLLSVHHEAQRDATPAPHPSRSTGSLAERTHRIHRRTPHATPVRGYPAAALQRAYGGIDVRVQEWHLLQGVQGVQQQSIIAPL